MIRHKIINTVNVNENSASDTLVAPDGRRDPLALLRIQRVVDDRSVLELRLPGVAVSEGQGVFAPVLLHRDRGLPLQRLGVVQLVHPVLVILAGVRTAALFPGLGSL